MHKTYLNDMIHIYFQKWIIVFIFSLPFNIFLRFRMRCVKHYNMWPDKLCIIYCISCNSKSSRYCRALLLLETIESKYSLNVLSNWKYIKKFAPAFICISMDEIGIAITAQYLNGHWYDLPPISLERFVTSSIFNATLREWQKTSRVTMENRINACRISFLMQLCSLFSVPHLGIIDARRVLLFCTMLYIL